MSEQRQTTREAQLEEALRRLRAVVGLIADELDLEPADCVVSVMAKGPDGKRVLTSISLAECFAEADRLAPGGGT